MFGWKEILDFWFGDLDEHGLPDSFHRNRWFRASRAFDREVRRRFFSLVLIASEGGLEHWRAEAGGTLAEIILLDQFTRHIHRGSALAFDHDRLARQICRAGMSHGQDVALSGLMRAFFYMPLQHSERREDQREGVACLEQLVASEQGLLKDFLGSFLQSARDHQAIVEQFGRFPHRNEALGRASTDEERRYLANSGKRFGQ